MNDVRMAIAAWPGRRRDELMWSGLAVAIGTSLAAAHALSAYRISAYALPAALLAIGFLLLILRQPVVGVAAMFLVIPLDAARLPIGIGHVAPSEAILLLVALSWLCRAAVDVDNVPLPRARDVPLVAIVVVTTLGITVAADTVYVTRVSLLWAALLVLYLQVQAFSLAQMRLVIGALAIGGSITAVIGAVAFLGSSDSSVLEGGLVTQDRAIAAGHDANHFGAIVAMSTLPAIALVVGNLRRHAWLLPAALFGPVAIAFSLSRGAMLALAAGLIVVLRSSRMRVAALGVTTTVVLLTLSGVVAFPGGDKLSTVQTRIATLGGSPSEIGGTRPQLWELAMSLGASHPFIGVGRNEFERYTGEQGLFEASGPLENAHNVFFGFIAETGLVGGAAFIAFVVMLARHGRRALRSPERLPRYLALGISASLVAFVVQGLTLDQLRQTVIGAIFFALAGMLTALADRATQAGPAAPVRVNIFRERTAQDA